LAQQTAMRGTRHSYVASLIEIKVKVQSYVTCVAVCVKGNLLYKAGCLIHALGTIRRRRNKNIRHTFSNC
jgi:hypothetical protein